MHRSAVQRVLRSTRLAAAVCPLRSPSSSSSPLASAAALAQRPLHQLAARLAAPATRRPLAPRDGLTLDDFIGRAATDGGDAQQAEMEAEAARRSDAAAAASAASPVQQREPHYAQEDIPDNIPNKVRTTHTAAGAQRNSNSDLTLRSRLLTAELARSKAVVAQGCTARVRELPSPEKHSQDAWPSHGV